MITAQGHFFFFAVRVRVLLLISANKKLPCLPFFRIRPKQSRRFLLGTEQHNKRWLLMHGILYLLFCCLFLHRTDGLPCYL